MANKGQQILGQGKETTRSTDPERQMSHDRGCGTDPKWTSVHLRSTAKEHQSARCDGHLMQTHAAALEATAHSQ